MLTEKEIRQKLTETEDESSKGVTDLCHKFELMGIRLALLTILGILNDVDWNNRISYLKGVK